MATSSALIKTILHKALAEGVYKDIITKSSNYYYFLGKTLEWADEDAPPAPFNSYSYERSVRDEIITMKQISPSDVAFVVDRYDWTTGEIYDMYDDQYTTEILGLNIISGGDNYTSLPTITITGGGGTGAKFYPIVLDGSIIGIEDNEELRLAGITDASNGVGYTSEPTVTVTGGGGSGAVIKAVVNIAPSRAQSLENCRFYVMTEDFNVYKCLDNNNNSQSMYKPLGTSVDPVTTEDGYVWKYMYTVPINLRNKFFSDKYIPVISALTNQFYSNGSIDTFHIDSKGKDYTYANITVNGDGYVESDPTLLTAITINEGGSGYSSPTVTFGDPVKDAVLFAAGVSTYVGQKITNSSNDFYQVVAPGVLGNTEPSHVYGTVINGTVGLKYIGSRVKGIVTQSGGVITGVTLLGGVYDISMTNGGSGYITAPSVSFSNGGGSNATATATLYNGSVTHVTITNAGKNYTSAPTVVFGNAWTATTAVSLGDQYSAGGKLYTVVKNGTTGSTSPSYTPGSAITAGSFTVGYYYTIETLGTTDWQAIGAPITAQVGTKFKALGVGSGTGTAKTTTVVNGTAWFDYVGVPATGTVQLRYGYGYHSAPEIVFSDTTLGHGAEASWLTTPSSAKLVPLIENGQISNIVIREAGVGYSSATITVTGDGSDAKITADLSVGSIQSLQANNEILVIPGGINAIGIISGGYGYGVANITIEGDGSGCTATATLDASSGRISKINITNPGKNYTFANVVINGNGYGAKARAIMSPYGGHGKNCPDELFSRTLMFYSNLSNDLVQGLPVNNDYRQVGIIKNPRKFADTTHFTGQIGTACYLLQGREGSGLINTDHFPRDTNIRVSRTIDGKVYQRLYRVVTSTTAAVLVQSLDNDVPSVNDDLATFRFGSGTISSSTTGSNSRIVTGSNTKFTTELDVGTKIYTANGVYIGVIQSITNDTSLTLVSPAAISATTGTVYTHVGVDGDSFINDRGNVFTISTVAAPTVDKYSGQLMFIDNKAGFTPSTEETVTLRTVIKF